jgi:DNA-binding transcriptional ArsR family regulator
MFDIDLVQAKPATQATFQVSLVYDLLNTLVLMINASQVEGLDQWIYATQTAMPPTLQRDMELALMLVFKSPALYTQLRAIPDQDPMHYEFEALLAWFQARSEDDFQAFIEDTLHHMGKEHEEESNIPSTSVDIEDTEALKAYLCEELDADQVARVIHLIRHPTDLKAQVISVITRFWEQFYSQAYATCRPIMERSVHYHRQQHYTGDFPTIFTAVTGRQLPKSYEAYKDAAQVIFIPSCYIGPYVTLHVSEAPPTYVMVHYNCRPTSGPVETRASDTPAIQDLFPPLKALADETRLQILAFLNGEEHYAQEIVEHLDISQSAVSRHLRLMISGGILNVRKEENMKYYTINEEILTALSAQLQRFKSMK